MTTTSRAQQPSPGPAVAADIFANLDWSDTPLGPVRQWSPRLRGAADMILASPLPMVLLCGAEGTMIYNDGYAAIAGERHPSIYGRAVRLGWPEVADFNNHVLEVVLAGGTLVYRDQRLLIERSGAPEEVWFDLTYSPIRDEFGSPVAALACVVETTLRVREEQARRGAESELRAAQERIQLALDAGAVIGTFVWDVQQDRVEADSRFLRTFGIEANGSDRSFALGELMEALHPDDRPSVAAEIERAVREGGRCRAEFRVRQLDGMYRWVEADGRCELDADGRPQRFPGVLIDISDRKQREGQLHRLTETLEERVREEVAKRIEAEERLRQAQKMEAIGQLTGGIAHDFNNLLTGIVGSLEMIQSRIARGRFERLPYYADAAMDSAKRAASLTHRLLAFARRQPLDPRPVDIRQHVEAIEELLHRSIGERTELKISADRSTWPTLCDPSQLENAIINLAVNARDAMPDGGRLTIAASNLTVPAGGQPDVAPGDYVLITVTDTGIGMVPDIVARAFDPFFTTKPLGRGTGLGLSMVYGFARQSKGDATIASQPGLGTTVSLYLPRLMEGPSDHDEPLLGANEAEASRERTVVLVVEDDAVVRSVLVDVLQDQGFVVLEASDSMTGLEILQSGATIDLLVSDIGLPGPFNGREMAEMARVVRPDLKILFITGYAESAAITSGFLLPGMEMLTKPFEVAALAGKIGTMLDRASLPSPSPLA